MRGKIDKKQMELLWRWETESPEWPVNVKHRVGRKTNRNTQEAADNTLSWASPPGSRSAAPLSRGKRLESRRKEEVKRHKNTQNLPWRGRAFWTAVFGLEPQAWQKCKAASWNFSKRSAYSSEPCEDKQNPSVSEPQSQGDHFSREFLMFYGLWAP